MKDLDSQDGAMKKRLNEHPVKTYARKMLREGEVENAESILACKDQVDRLQDMVEELGKMTNEELPKLVDKIRGSLGLTKQRHINRQLVLFFLNY